jgi:hypothetical protein
MSIPENFDMSKILPILQSFGVSPDKLGPEKMNRLLNISEKVSDPSKITPDVAHEVLDILGISTRGTQEPVIRRGKKVGRNDACSCGSNVKYKKCCGKNN